MKRVLFALLGLALLVPARELPAQNEDDTTSSSCTFADGRQISARYRRPLAKKETPPNGKVWLPGGAAITLFTETDITVGGTTVPVGGYTLYLIPGRKEWTLIISRNTNVTAAYDATQDLARTSMQTGEMSQSETQLAVHFGHTAPKTCEINVDFGKTKAWAEFYQK
jgi:hypothetical protein